MTYPLFGPSLHDSSSTRLRVSQILGPLSAALDMTEGQPQGHCIRSAYIGIRIGQDIGITGTALNDLYYTILLKDLGCSSNAARICQLYLADDIGFKHDFKTIDGSLAAALRFVFAKTGPDRGLVERVRAILNIVQNGGAIVDELIETRCHRGAQIAARMGFSVAVQAGISALDEHWNGAGRPAGLRGEDIPKQAQIALIAQVTDIFHQSAGRDAALQELRRRAGVWFDPALVAAVDRLARDPGFWADLDDPDLPQTVLKLPPALAERPVSEGYLDNIAAAFSDVVDAKSPYTADHSTRVAHYADIISEQIGLPAAHRRWLRRGAMLHDLGKLGVSNAVLDKPAKLSPEEFATIRAHPGKGATILSQIDAMRDLAPIAAGHHEKLDGSGYPAGLGADALALEVRIVTVADVFDALSAKRPYRDALPVTEVFAMMQREVGTAFDPLCLEALRAGIDPACKAGH